MRNKKVILLISVLLVLVISASAAIVSFSLADEPTGEEYDVTQAGNLGEINKDQTTIIDMIIKNSNNSALGEDSKYHVINIVSDAVTETGLSKYAAALGFKNYVFDANKTDTTEGALTFVQDNIEVTVLSVAALNGNPDIIKNADFIYISNNPASPYKEGNDFSEKAYNELHSYAVGYDKPLIIDYMSDEEKQEQGSTNYFNKVINLVYSKNYADYNTYAYKATYTGIEDFTLYSGLVAMDDRNKTYDADHKSKYLFISPDGSDGDLKLKVYNDITSGDSTFIKRAYYKSKADDLNIESGNLDSSFIEMENKSMSDALAMGNDALKEYDFIFIENGNYNSIVNDQTKYNQLVALSYSGKHVIYDGRLGKEISGTTSGVTDTYKVNFEELLYMVSTTTGIAKYQNIMISSYGFFDAMAENLESSTTRAKKIADLINSSTYRDNAGSGGGKKFTVLELQPCYPIDEEVAENNPVERYNAAKDSYVQQYKGYKSVKGNYYSIPGNVLAGVTKEELPEGTEYYAFELSKAKIAAATGIKYNQINLVQMSTEAFAGSKKNITETYDLIYIGGNTSALRTGYYDYAIADTMEKVGDNPGVPYFDMYYHTGLMMQLTSIFNGTGDGAKVLSGQYAYGTTKLNGSYVKTFVAQTGNDITSSEVTGLNEYITNGMPIIISDDAVTAYEASKAMKLTGKYDNTSMDPDSNIYKVVDSAYKRSQESTGKNVVWNFDKDATALIKNENSQYGNTLTPYVKVFASKDGTEQFDGTTSAAGESDKIAEAIANGTTRPKLSIDAMPQLYVEGNSSTYLKSKTLEYTFSITQTNVNVTKYKVKLYIDDNNNGLFDEDEVVATSTASAGGGNKISYGPLGDDFYGPIYWKLSVEDSGSTGGVVSYAGLSKIERADTVEKAQVSILQIIPEGAKSQQSTAHLYFCPECQLANRICQSNIFYYGGTGTNLTVFYEQHLDNTSNACPSFIGPHEHKFGIPEYDSALGYDDWDSNLADVLTGEDGDYDFDIDIMQPKEYETLNKECLDAGLKMYAEEILGKTDTYDSYVTNATNAYDDYISITEGEVAKTEKTLRSALEALATNPSAQNSVYDKNIFDEVLESKEYYLIWSTDKTGYNSYDPTGQNWFGAFKDKEGNYAIGTYDGKAHSITDIYKAWSAAKTKQQNAYNEYWHNTLLASGTNWLYDNYGMVILGPSEDFNGEDINLDGCQTLKSYINQGGNTLLFHDTMCKLDDDGAVNLTNSLSSTFGLDYFNGMTLDETASKSGTGYTKLLQYKATDSSKYFFSSWIKDPTKLSDWYNSNNTFGYRTSKMASTEMVVRNSGMASLPYRYADYNYSVAGFYALDSNTENSKFYGTRKAAQLNEGIVTMYPFYISSSLNISGTHGQYHALNLEDSDVVCWYTLGGGNNSKAGSSIYSASPLDATDAYFIYSKGNVTYCGAGHANITGPGKDNNDERRLFINIICNSARQSAMMPMITVYDPSTKKEAPGSVVKEDEEGLYISAEGKTNTVEFGLSAKIDEKDANYPTINKVEIYFDYLDADGNQQTENVATFDKQLKSDEQIYFMEGTKLGGIKLDPKYFAGYQDYTYIAIKVTDSKGRSSIKKIKIKIVRSLWDLTKDDYLPKSYYTL